MMSMRIALFQIDCQWEDKESTKGRILNMFNNWGGHADCLVFPEMVLSGFSMTREKTTLIESDHNFFMSLAKKNSCKIIYGGVENGYNSVFLTDCGAQSVCVYQKRHLFRFGGECESYKQGKISAIVNIGGLRTAFAICYDLRFSYHFWDQAKDCDAFVVIASWPECRREHWSVLLRARAIENQAYIVGVNRVGSDPRLAYSGDSAVYGPFGECKLECGATEGIYFCDLNPEDVAKVRSKFLFLEDRLK